MFELKLLTKFCLFKNHPSTRLHLADLKRLTLYPVVSKIFKLNFQYHFMLNITVCINCDVNTVNTLRLGFSVNQEEKWPMHVSGIKTGFKPYRYVASFLKLIPTQISRRVRGLEPMEVAVPE